jgi:hypothetical protein
MGEIQESSRENISTSLRPTFSTLIRSTRLEMHLTNKLRAPLEPTAYRRDVTILFLPCMHCQTVCPVASDSIPPQAPLICVFRMSYVGRSMIFPFIGSEHETINGLHSRPVARILSQPGQRPGMPNCPCLATGLLHSSFETLCSLHTSEVSRASAPALSTVLRTTMHAFLWKHAIFRHLPSRNPSTDQNAILHDWLRRQGHATCPNGCNRLTGATLQICEILPKKLFFLYLN